MKSVYITLALISLLAFTQATDFTCQFTCNGSSNPDQCNNDLINLNLCVKANCDQTKIASGDTQAIIQCFSKCQLGQDLQQPFLNFVLCQLKSDPNAYKLVQCARDSILGCQNNFKTCQTAFVSQIQCIQNKCTGISANDNKAIQQCIFQTCQSDSSIVNI
ncbi:hypothetical protein ABPG72_014397 [Tetrahymena utriculariae]